MNRLLSLLRKILPSLISILLVLEFDVVRSQDTSTSDSDKPKIKGQRALFVNEDQSITISLFDLEVEDDDDIYPIGFKLELFEGSNYTFSNTTVTPAKNFNGKLKVPVRVNDGDDNSNKWDLEITVNPVNDAPVIESQQSLAATSGVPVAIQFSHLTVQDPDDNYPNGFVMKIQPGSNYSVSGNQITPSASFEGTLSVPLRVNDGSADSDIFSFKIQVTRGNQKPIITSQVPVIINEDESYTISTSSISVSDPGGSWPNGYVMAIGGGANYTTSGFTVTPTPNYSGTLIVPLTVNDGEKTSDPFNFKITVRGINDAPTITLVDSAALRIQNSNPVQLISDIQISDPDNDSLTFVEIAFAPETYSSANDKLIFANTSLIKGVFDSQNGILALIGKAPITEYVTAIKSIEYQSTGSSARSNTTLNISASDGRAVSNKVLKQIVFGNSTVVGSLDIPTGFTPNGDMINDTWSIRAIDNTQNFDQAILRVYTKAGILVFESTGLQSEWDGRLNGQILPADVYFYTVDFKLATPEANIKGIVTILR